METNTLSGEVMAAVIEVHRQLEPVPLESSYEAVTTGITRDTI